MVLVVGTTKYGKKLVRHWESCQLSGGRWERSDSLVQLTTLPCLLVFVVNGLKQICWKAKTAVLVR